MFFFSFFFYFMLFCCVCVCVCVCFFGRVVVVVVDFWILDLVFLDFVYKNPISVVRPPAGAFFSG